MGEGRYVFQYRKGGLDGIKRYMGEFGAKVLSGDPLKRSVNDKWNLLKETLVNSMKKIFPRGRYLLDWLQSLKQLFINVSYHILVASLTLMALF